MIKNLITILLVWTSGLSTLYAQGGSVVEPALNRDCFAAEDLCGVENIAARPGDQTPLNGPCNLPDVKVYYKFRAASTTPGLHLVSFGTYVGSSSFKLFGPYDTYQEGCNQITQLAASAIVIGPNATNHSVDYNSEKDKIYILEITREGCGAGIRFTYNRDELVCTDRLSCKDCIPQFNPGPGKYVISAWVKEDEVSPTKTLYTTPSVEVSFPSASLSYTYTPEGQIVDGWQRIEGIVEVPVGSTDFTLKLQVSSGTAFFDDVRVFPFDGSMMSYVYDPVTLRLSAELDERNYAKFYEYDEEGKLIRIKKETEKGVMTIQENRENSAK